MESSESESPLPVSSPETQVPDQPGSTIRGTPHLTLPSTWSIKHHQTPGDEHMTSNLIENLSGPQFIDCALQGELLSMEIENSSEKAGVEDGKASEMHAWLRWWPVSITRT